MPLRKSDRDLPGLTVLALLRTGPRHTWDMHRIVVDTHKDFVTGMPRSLYHAVDRLLRDNLIRRHATDRRGPRPERTVYTLTEHGELALVERIRRLLETPDADATPFVAALSYVSCLTPAEAAAALRTRIADLDGRRAAIAAGHASVPDELPRFLLVEGEFEQARLRAERDWVAALVDDVESGRLDWPTDPAVLGAMVPGSRMD